MRNVLRRRFIGASIAAAAGLGLRHAKAREPLRFGTTPVFLDDQLALLATWQAYLGSLLQRPVQFVQRRSYREISDLLLTDAIDVAWICGLAYVLLESRLRPIAVPLYQGKPLYRSHLVVPVSDTRTRAIVDLRGKVFAFSDPQSNSGYLVPRVELIRAKEAPDHFFRRTFFTFGHRKVVEAVQVGLAHGGAVDGYVWDTLKKDHPEATAGVRVAWQSSLHGFPPVVARRTLPAEEATKVAAALIAMPENDSGRRILRQLNIDGFIPGSPPMFDTIRQGVRLHAGATG